MKYSLNKKYITGTAVPISALRTENSCGIGEFSDLIPFGDFCKECGLDLIQLLPVNDTGFQSSPYSALSAFALHPAYISLGSIPEANKFKAEIKKIKSKWDSKTKVHFNSVLKDKLAFLKKIYTENFESIEKSKKIKTWEKNNPWIISYAVFSYLKEKNKYKNWTDWDKYKDPSDNDIEKLYTSQRKKTLFYSWVQYNLENQLISAVNHLEAININLKGDLPILMNFDSADVWESRQIFNTLNRAGAPPDMYADDGQNWGFPTYFWEAMEEDNYAWWKNRLKQAAKFYHAYRIDHVLGFFRIWTIPEMYTKGSMGYYSPNNYLSTKDLEEIGISGDRLIWMSKPHVPGYELRDKVGHETNEVIKALLNQIGDEDLYLFKDEIVSESDIRNNLEISNEAKERMVEFFCNIALLKVAEDNYASTWFYYKSRAFNSMTDHEKFLFTELLAKKNVESEKLWESQGLKLLKFMKESEDMLVCAEDLGTIPDCVPTVLGELGILGLHVTRWSKDYKEYGQPYIKPTKYNYLSVSTPAVHDSSTVRQWWKEDSTFSEISQALDLKAPLGDEPSEQEVYKLYEGLLKTSSQIAMFQFQDLLALDKNLQRSDPKLERINVPGTSNDENWSYRMDMPLEKLLEQSNFINIINKLMIKRG